MSEAKPNPNTSPVEGELSLDDLSQIAGGTSAELQLGAGASFDLGGTDILKQSDNMFTSFDGVKGSTLDQDSRGSVQSLNVALAFP